LFISTVPYRITSGSPHIKPGKVIVIAAERQAALGERLRPLRASLAGKASFRGKVLFRPIISEAWTSAGV
jgi:hypothetical protein